MQPIKKKSAAAVKTCPECALEEASVPGVADARIKDRGGPEFPAERMDEHPDGTGGGLSGSLVEAIELDRVGASEGVAGLPVPPTLSRP